MHCWMSISERESSMQLLLERFKRFNHSHLWSGRPYGSSHRRPLRSIYHKSGWPVLFPSWTWWDECRHFGPFHLRNSKHFWWKRPPKSENIDLTLEMIMLVLQGITVWKSGLCPLNSSSKMYIQTKCFEERSLSISACLYSLLEVLCKYLRETFLRRVNWGSFSRIANAAPWATNHSALDVNTCSCLRGFSKAHTWCALFQFYVLVSEDRSYWSHPEAYLEKITPSKIFQRSLKEQREFALTQHCTSSGSAFLALY